MKWQQRVLTHLLFCTCCPRSAYCKTLVGRGGRQIQSLMREEDREGEAEWVWRGCGRRNLSINAFIALLGTQVTAWMMMNQTLLPGLNKSWTLSCSNNQPWVCVFTGPSTSVKNLIVFLVLPKELFGKIWGWVIRWLGFPFLYDIMVEKDPVPTHNATILLYLARGRFPLSSMSDEIIAQISACKQNLIWQVEYLTSRDDTIRDQGMLLQQTVTYSKSQATSFHHNAKSNY